MDFAVHIHQSGPFRTLPIYEPGLMSIKNNGRVTLVAQMVIWDISGEHLCKGNLTNQFFRLRADIPKGQSLMTLVHARVEHIRGPVLTIDEQAKALLHQQCTSDALMKTSETCVGLGALGLGMEYAGFKVQTVNDIRKAFCDHLRNENRYAVVQGDICKMPTIVQLHESGQGASTYAFGFNCQPFSTLGDNKQGNDERAATLTYGLYSAYLLQMKIVVMECVPNAAQSQFVKQNIQHYMNHTDAHRSDVILELADVWPSFRKRWWCVLTHPAIGKVTLQGLPKHDQQPTMSDIMPNFMDLTGDKLEQLILSEHERHMFHTLGKGTQSNMVDKNSTLPTALHSWGNQCIVCKCGCGREFSYQRLQKEGIHGALVYIANEFPRQSLRHLGPQEMALLTGFPKEFGWDDDQRMLTAGVGQLASSIQSAWIAALIRQHLQEQKFIPTEVGNPKHVLACVCIATLDLQQKWMGSYTTVEMDLFRESIEQWLFVPPKDVDPINHDETPEDQRDPPNNGSKGEQLMIEDWVPPKDLEGLPFDKDETKDEVDGFSQAVGQQISMIESIAASKGELKFGELMCHPNTGGLHAFAVANPSSNSKVAAEPTKASAGTDLEGVSTKTVEPVSTTVVAKELPEHKYEDILYQHVHPEDLVQNKLVVLDRDGENFRAIKISPGQTVGDFVNAEQSIHNIRFRCTTTVGRKLLQEEKLTNQIVVLHTDDTDEQTSIAYREMQLQPIPRLQSLLLQQGAVAVDEMTYYLTNLGKPTGLACVPPLIIDSLLDIQVVTQAWFGKFNRHGTSNVTAVLIESHWVPFVFEKGSGSWNVITTQEGKHLWPQLQFNETHDLFEIPMPQSQFLEDCGFQTIGWIQAVIARETPQGMSSQNADELRQCYWKQLYIQDSAKSLSILRLGGHKDELETALSAILREHGVFIERVQDRAKQLIQKLGSQAVVNAIKSNRPWQALKQIANEQSPAVRLILEDEFQRVLQDRTKDGRPVKTQKKDHSGKNRRNDPLHMKPPDIHVPDGVFGQSDGTVIGQLTIQQIHPKAKGIVIMNEQEWMPFRDQQVSAEGLAFLVVAPFSEELSQKGQQIRFPAQSVITGEPILISAMMFQHGSKQVGRCQPAQTHSIDQVETQTIKVILYRDQCPGDWKEVVAKPIKFILQYLECLQTCQIAECSCCKWHRSQHDYDPIIDLWQRDFLTIHFQKTKAGDAALFTCLMRIAKSCFAQLSASSGLNGIYVEPRQQDGKKMDDGFHTIWLNKHSYETAQAVKATTPMTTALVRVTHRFGLRVDAARGSELHKFLKPDAPYIPGNDRLQFIMGPLPFGTTKKAMSKLFEQWDWKAQPIHPCGRSQDHSGLMWLVAAAAPPQHLVYTMSHGDVMITKEEASLPKPVSIPKIEASKFTKTSYQGETKEWDPWASWQPTTTAKPMSSTSYRAPDITQSQIAAVEARIESNVLAKIPHDVEMTSAEPRISALEAQMKELQQAQQVCQDQTTKVAGKVDMMQNQLEAQTACFQSCLESQMAEQMKKIETLLHKRKSTE